MSSMAATYTRPTVFRHPIKWLGATLQKLAYVGIGSYVGMLFVAALYYTIFELSGHMHMWWHEAVPNSDLRHTIRDVWEGIIGGMVFKFVVYDPYKRKNRKRATKKPSLLDKLEMRLGIPNPKDNKPFSPARLMSLAVLVPLYAAPGFFAGYYILQWIHGMHIHASLPLSANPSTNTFAQKLEASFTDDYPKKLVGYFSLFFFGLRPARGMFGDVQTYFIQRRIATGRLPRWYNTAAYKARYTELTSSTSEAPIRVGVWGGRIMKGLIPVFVAGAIGGWYILTYIA